MQCEPDRAFTERRLAKRKKAGLRKGKATRESEKAALTAVPSGAQAHALVLGGHEDAVELLLEGRQVVEEREQVGVAALLVHDPRVPGVELLEADGHGVLELVVVLDVVLEQVLPALQREALEGGRRVVEGVEAAADLINNGDQLIVLMEI